MTGAKFIPPPAETSDWNRRLASYLLAHQTANPDEVLREWYAALCRNVRHWPTQRETRLCSSLEEAHRQALAYAELEGATYCEGLIQGAMTEGPERAIWCASDDHLVCFTHHVNTSHGLQGLAFDLKVLYTLRNGYGIRGPYLFSDEPTVMTRCIPRPLPRVGVMRNLPMARPWMPTAMVMQ